MKEKYDEATEVVVNKRGKLQVRYPQYRVPTAEDVVFMTDSPNYCNKNLKMGSVGECLFSFLCAKLFHL